MNYKTIMICALLAGSMQQAWGMEEEGNNKEPETDTMPRTEDGKEYVIDPAKGLHSLIEAFKRIPTGFHESPENQAIAPKVAQWKKDASNISNESLVTHSEAVDQMSIGLRAGYIAQELNVAIKLYLDRCENDKKNQS